MKAMRSRRAFLADVGCGALAAAVGSGLASELGLADACGEDKSRAEDQNVPALTFGSIEPLVRLMQETPIDRLLPALSGQLSAGVDLRSLLAAGALANARTFGGEDYVGFHTLMALAPAYHMSRELPEDRRALPVFKVLYRNTNRIHEHGGRNGEVLKAIPDSAPGAGEQDVDRAGERLRDAVRNRDVHGAEKMLAALAQRTADDAFNGLLTSVEDATEVHRVVLPYRAWDLLDLIGREHAETLLRQSVRYCVKAEQWAAKAPQDEPRRVLPKVLDEHHLLGQAAGTKTVDDQWIEEMSRTLFGSTPAQAADAAAAALAEGILPGAVGEAISLAANQLVLRDVGRTAADEVPGKPLGSVHGDSIGVHACDSANAWRNMARISNARNSVACLVLGAYQVASDRVNRGGDFLNWKPLPLQQHVERIQTTDGPSLLREAEEAIRGNLQARAAAVVYRYGQLSHADRPMFDLLLKYAVSEDGSLHAEKYYRTVCEEFAVTRPVFRWRQVVGLARVTASEFGRPAPGYAEARDLLKV